MGKKRKIFVSSIRKMGFGNMDDYSLSDLAGSGAIILASIGGLLTIILSSRCYCKFRLGLTDDCNLCMCERKPPPDPENPEEEDKKDKDKKDAKATKKDKKATPPVKKPKKELVLESASDDEFQPAPQPEP